MGLLSDVGGFLGSAGNIIGGAIGAIGQNQTNQANAKQAQLNRDFEERMSSTSWQRGVADIKAAGLNPALAYDKGGASSPGGSTAQMTNTMAGAQTTAAAAADAFNQWRSTSANVEATKANAEKSSAEAALTRATTMSQIEDWANKAGISAEQRANMRETILAQNNQANSAQRLNDANRDYVYDQDKWYRDTTTLRANQINAQIQQARSSAANLNASTTSEGLRQAELRNWANFMKTDFGKFMSTHGKATAQAVDIGAKAIGGAF